MKETLHSLSPPHSESGFTLVELAMVLVIFSLLVGGMLMGLSAQRQIAEANESQKNLNDIRDALIGFAVTKGRLPCPADPTAATGSAGAGIERAPTAGGCTGGAAAVAGVLPWATLGVQELDVWGRRLSYRVTGVFAQPIVGQAAFTLASAGDINVRTTSAGTLLAANIPAVVVSHGPNGLGGYLPTGAQMTASADADEIENANANAEFVSKTAATSTFDDQVVWVTPNILMNRMVAAQKLP
jgi:prepilin-type N-terminal cleavage/methylation domain-containing protein